MSASRPKSAASNNSAFLRQLSTLDGALGPMEDEAQHSLEEKPVRKGSSRGDPTWRSNTEKLIGGAQQPPSQQQQQQALRPLAAPIKQSQTGGASGGGGEIGSDSSDEDDESDEEDDDERGPSLEGVYNPSDYDHLNVSADIKELFQYITRYTPQAIELEHKLKPFIPDFIPAVGDIDAFIKVGRPDGKSETLGLTVIDEPSARQSDPTVLDLQLRAISKESSSKTMAVKTLEDAEKNVKEIDSWMKSISDLHRSKPPPAVHYARNMPSIDSLMQEWDADFEELLKEVGLPTADTSCTLPEYVDIVCGLLDIPIYKSRIQSLHVLFSLFLAFKKHQHFQNQRRDNNFGDDKDGSGVDHLVL